MKLEKEIALACTISGLVLAYFFSPVNSYEQKTLLQLSNSCSGLARVDARVSKTFFSQKSNLIGLLSDRNSSVLALLNDFPVVEGDRVTIMGRATRNGKSCWLFPKRVIHRD